MSNKISYNMLVNIQKETLLFETTFRLLNEWYSIKCILSESDLVSVELEHYKDRLLAIKQEIDKIIRDCPNFIQRHKTLLNNFVRIN